MGTYLTGFFSIILDLENNLQTIASSHISKLVIVILKLLRGIE